MKSKVFLFPLLVLSGISMSLPVKQQTDVMARDGSEEASSEIIPGDTSSSFRVKRLDLRDESEAIFAFPSSSSSISSEDSIIKLEGLSKRENPLVKRTIKLALKSAVHGITGTYTWIFQITINPDEEKSRLGPHRLGAKCQFEPVGSSPGTSVSTFSARQSASTMEEDVSIWRIQAFYDDATKGSLIPVIEWEETFSAIPDTWGAAVTGIKRTALQWAQNGRSETIDPSMYTLTIQAENVIEQDVQRRVNFNVKESQEQ